jgi:UDP-glucose 4-epimerase
MKTAFVTGGNGFIGANLLRHLVSLGHQVHTLARSSGTDWRLNQISKEITVHHGAVEDAEAMRRLIAKVKPDWIFHLAAYGAYSSQRDLRTMINTNIIGTANLVEASLASGCAAFINTGSSSEYGFTDHAPSETDLPDPNSDYAFTKSSATLYCRFMAKRENAHIITLRVYNIYGPYEEPTRFIPTLILHGLRDSLPPLVDPNISRDFTYIDDLSAAYVLAAEHTQLPPGTIYNVGTGVQTTIGDAVKVIQDLLPISKQPNWSSMPNRVWDTTTWVADNSRIKKDLGWTVATTFKEGMKKTITWFNDHPDIVLRYWEKIRKQNLPQ